MIYLLELLRYAFFECAELTIGSFCFCYEASRPEPSPTRNSHQHATLSSHGEGKDVEAAIR